MINEHASSSHDVIAFPQSRSTAFLEHGIANAVDEVATETLLERYDVFAIAPPLLPMEDGFGRHRERAGQ